MSAVQGSQSQGIHGTGGRSYSPDQYALVVRAVLTFCQWETRTVADLVTLTGVPGRTIRQIVSDADGVEFVLGGTGDGYQIAATPEDARRITARLLSQSERMSARVERRMKAAKQLTEVDTMALGTSSGAGR